MKKLCFIDLESTGTRFWKNGIHSLAGIIDINGEVKEEFDFKVCPYKDALIEDEALAVSNVTREQVLQYPPMADVHKQLCKMLSRYVDKYDKTDKFFLVGYNNASFDNQFLRAFFTQCGDAYFGSWFHSNTLDCMVLATQYLLEHRHKMENFQLRTVAAELGIDVESEMLHNALYDCNLTRKIYYIVTKTGVFLNKAKEVAV